MSQQTHYVGDHCPGGHHNLDLPCVNCGCDLGRHHVPDAGYVGYPCLNCDCQMYRGQAGAEPDRPKGDQATTVLLEEVDRTGGHTRVAVRVGRGRDSRALAGTLTLRNDEWDELLTAGTVALRDRIEVIADRVDEPS